MDWSFRFAEGRWEGNANMRRWGPVGWLDDHSASSLERKGNFASVKWKVLDWAVVLLLRKKVFQTSLWTF